MNPQQEGTTDVPNLLREAIENSVQELREKTFVKFGVDVNPGVTFDVKGMTAAEAIFDTQVLDFNLQLGVDNREEYLDQIVGHEYVHLVADTLYEHRGHGKQWKDLMADYGLRPDRHYTLNTNNIVRRVAKIYLYQCACKTWPIDAKTHANWSSLSHQVVCPRCKGVACCTNDRAASLLKVKPGTMAHKAMTVLEEYEADGLALSANVAILLLQDYLSVSYATARAYYYKYRPTHRR